MDTEGGGNNDRPRKGGKNTTNTGGSKATAADDTEPMDVDASPASEQVNEARFNAFSAALGKYRHAQHIEQMAIDDVRGVVNSGAAVPYSEAEINAFLEKMQENLSLMIVRDSNVIHFF